MNAIAPRGWCPTLSEPMPSGDGLLVRIKPPGGVVSAAAACALATEAARGGNGVIELTSRASIQVRGLTTQSLARFAAAMIDAGLAHQDPAVERRRSLIASPLAGDDPGASRHAAAVASAVETMLAQEVRLAALPPKFGFLIDGGGVLPVGAAPADIRATLDRDACWIAADGGPLAAACEAARAADTIARLALGFLELAGRCRTAPRRMRALIAEIGAPAIFVSAGLSATRVAAPVREPAAVGWLPYGAGHGAFGVGLPFGAADADMLTALAELSVRFGDGTLRLTPWRAVAIPGVTEPDGLRAAVTALGLVVEPADPRIRIFACPGRPACAAATVATRDHAARLAALGLTGTVHVSGCAKGCAHPARADITLVGADGSYAFIRNGRASDAPVREGVTIGEAMTLLRDDSQGEAA